MPHNAEFEDSASRSHALSYRDRFLNHWAIVRLLPNMQRVVVDRYCRRSDAEGHLRFLRQCIPEGKFVVMFDEQDSRECDRSRD